MVKIGYSDEFVCPTCGRHTALVCHTDGTHQAHCMICDVYYDVEIAPITNAGRIRGMTDEELAELWWELVDCGECPVHRECKMTGQDCKRLALDWLKQEAKEWANDRKRRNATICV